MTPARILFWVTTISLAMTGSAMAQASLLNFVDVVRDDVNGVDGLATAESVTVSPDGRHVYAAGQNDAALAVFSRDAGTGVLTFVEVVRDGVNGVDGLATAFSVTISPDGGHVYAAGFSDDALAVFSRDAGTGVLTFVEVVRDGVNGVDGLAGAISVTVSPDGGHVYAAGQSDAALAVFSRDAGTGVLTFVEVVRNGVNGVEGLSAARGVTVSPDGGHVYVAGFSSMSLSVFSRDAGTGVLTFVEWVRDGVNGVDGLHEVYSVMLSPDGRHLYAAGSFVSALVVFSRDAGTGVLTFVEVVRGVDTEGVGLSGVRTVTVSPDGEHVYAAGPNQSAMAVFSRDGDSGALTFVEEVRDGVNGVDGLSGAKFVTFSPDGGQVYVAGGAGGDGALAIFRKRVVGLLDGFVFAESTGAGLSCAALQLTLANTNLEFIAVTDVNGYYLFYDVPVGTYNVRVISPGLGEAVLDDIVLEENIALRQNFALPTGAQTPDINGIVTDKDTMEPLVGALVTASVGGIVVDTTYTCASGAYEIFIPSLKAKGSIEVTLRFSLTNYLDAEQIVVVNPGEITQADQPLEKAIQGQNSLVGFVYVEGTKGGLMPVANAQVIARGGNSSTSTRTDVNGAFDFANLVDGSYVVRASALGYNGATDQRYLSKGAVVTTSLTLSVEPQNSEPTDINSDGSVNSIDIQLVINDVLGIGEPGVDADVNADGTVNSIDIQVVINRVLGV